MGPSTKLLGLAARNATLHLCDGHVAEARHNAMRVLSAEWNKRRRPNYRHKVYTLHFTVYTLQFTFWGPVAG